MRRRNRPRAVTPRAAGPPFAHGEAFPRPGPSRNRSPQRFFVLVFVLSIPLWAIGAAVDVQLMPGLPLSSLGAVCPLLAALLLVHQESGTAGVKGLLSRAFDYRQIRQKAWYVPALLLMPGVSLTNK